MKKLLSITSFFFAGIAGIAQTCPQPFFSEYVEGSSNNKAMEIYNPGNLAIDLEDYVVYRYNNGSVIASDSLFPIGMLAAHDVYIFGNPSAAAEILAESDTLHTMTFYNGDDAIILVNRITGDTLDAIGIIGVDPGTNWPVGAGATSEFTLVRKVEVTGGTTDWALGATQWDVYPQNTFDYIGMHDAVAIAPLFTADWTSVTDGFTVTFTDASTGPVSTYNWTFGDGASSTDADPVHTYATEGDYEVCLIVGGCDLPDTLCATITICDAAIADFSYLMDDLTATFTNESSGADLSYAWDFGDGSLSLLENPEHTYAAAGDYTVCLIAYNACSADTTCITLSTCPLPVVDFSSSTVGLDVNFTNETVGGVDYSWIFGDGGMSTEMNPSHTYSMAGTYVVCLIATNECGAITNCDTITLCDPINASFSSSQSVFDVEFTNESDGAIVSYAWDFGDGASSSEENPVHTYTEDGEYTVCLIISNECFDLDTICQTILINTAGISELNLTNVTVYPNPFNTQFTINLGASFEQVSVVMTDINGRVIETKTVNQSSNLLVDLNVEAGVYFVQITAGNNSTVIKIIKE